MKHDISPDINPIGLNMLHIFLSAFINKRKVVIELKCNGGI